MTRNVCLGNEFKKLKRLGAQSRYLCERKLRSLLLYVSVSSPGISSRRSSRLGTSNSSLWEGHINPLVQPPVTHTGAVNNNKKKPKTP